MKSIIKVVDIEENLKTKKSKFESISNDDLLKEIEKSWENKVGVLEKDFNVKIIQYDKDIFNLLLKRYFDSKAPFHKNSHSWKDFIIWNGYSTEIKKTNDAEIIFISSNYKDFSNDNTKNKEEYYLHKDLLEDIENKNVFCYKNINSFFNQNEKIKSIKEQYDIEQDIKSIKESILNKIDNNFIFNNYSKNIFDIIQEEFKRMRQKHRLFFYNLIDISNINIIYKDVYIVAINSKPHIFGQLNISCFLEKELEDELTIPFRDSMYYKDSNKKKYRMPYLLSNYYDLSVDTQINNIMNRKNIEVDCSFNFSINVDSKNVDIDITKDMIENFNISKINLKYF